MTEIEMEQKAISLEKQARKCRRKYVKESTLDENTKKALQFFEGLIREGTIDYSLSDAFYELGFEGNTDIRYTDDPGGSITLKWAY